MKNKQSKGLSLSLSANPIHLIKGTFSAIQHVFAGVSKEGENLVASGGRVLVCVGKGESVQEAVKEAYKCVESVQFDGMQYRKDIAYQALGKE